MSQIRVDVERLEAFAQSLALYREQVAELTSTLNARFNELGDTWQDQEFERFTQEFEQIVGTLRQCLEGSDTQLAFLRRKLESAHQYLDVRL